MTSSVAVQREGLGVFDRLMIVAMLVSGVAAAWLGISFLWAATPVAALLVYASARRAALSLVVEDGTPSELPPRLEQRLAETTSQLSRGDARQLLANVVRAARPLFATRESAFDAESELETRVHVTDLVAAACETALELQRLDGAVPTGAATGAHTDDVLHARYKHAREELATRLRDAATALSELYVSGLEHGTPASERVAELAGALRSDANARGSAMREMDALLETPESPDARIRS